MKYLLRRAIFLVPLFISHFVSATHIIGGEITYQCIGNQQYKFKLSIYTECGSPIILEDVYHLKYFAESLDIPLKDALSFQVSKVAENEVSFYCSSVETNCGDGAYRGIKRLDYEGMVDLGAHGRAKDWLFFWQKSARSEEINTLLAPENEDYYAEVLMNNVDASCNNSPTFSSNPAITSCIGFSIVFSNTATDKDGDQLRFKLAAPRSSYEDEVIYQEGYDFQKFIKHSGDISLDNNTGDLSFTSSAEEIGVTDIVVEERRNGILISRITRGIQVTSSDCTNESPVISDLEGLDTTAVTVCAGETIDVLFSASDPDGQNLLMNIQSGRFDQFSVENNGTPTPVGNLIWHTTKLDTGVHLFTIRVDDGVCPEPGVATKTFLMNILSTPNFELGDDVNTNCDTPVKVAPVISGGDGDYSFNWSNGEKSETVNIGPGRYYLTVTDGNGCEGKDSINVSASVIPDFNVLKRCFGEPVQFADSTKTTATDITAWRWNFGDGGTSTTKHPTHNYSAPGEYEVSLEVTDNDNPACKIEVKKPVVVCGDIDFYFTPQDTCSGLPTSFDISSNAADECDIESYAFDYGDGTYGSAPSHTYLAGGEYLVTLTVTTRAKCEQEYSRQVTILQSPVIDIDNGESAYLNCANPDILLTTSTVPGDGGNLNYTWNTGAISTDLQINEAGKYIIKVTDDNSCYDTDAFDLLGALKANFRFDAFCELGDSLRFEEEVFHAFDIVSWAWDFGDESTFTDANPPPHRYTDLGDYEVKLKVVDENDCSDSITHTVYNTYLAVDEFDVTPNDVTICVKDTVFGYGPDGAHINSYLWDFKNGISSTKKDTYLFYVATGTYDVELEVNYNMLDGVNLGCRKIFGEQVEVYPELDVDILSSRICRDIAVEFGFERTAGDLNIPVIAAHWDFGDGAGTSNEMSPSYIYKETGLYNLVLNIEDQLGCLKKIDKIAKVERVATPDFSFDQVCGNELMTFSTAFRDTLENITHYRWVFDESDTIEGVWPMPKTTLHTLGRGDQHDVGLTVWNEFSHCDRNVKKEVIPLELPKVNFEVDTICINETAYFKNTTKGEATITGYQWVFHDGSTSEETEPTKNYTAAGAYEVTLIAFNELNCTDSITKNVVVLDIPHAAFRTEEEFVEAFIPIQFINESSGDIDTYSWSFGDGRTSGEEHPIHTYDTIKVYWVGLIVEDINGCADSLVQRTDLNVHLDLPTAFSPNNDNKNDELGLIHHGIKELYEFKIYNRWGQLVFDGQNNLDAVWDGSLNGARQDGGVYVAHVKARGAYDIQFNFKKNVTLLR